MGGVDGRGGVGGLGGGAVGVTRVKLRGADAALDRHVRAWELLSAAEVFAGSGAWCCEDVGRAAEVEDGWHHAGADVDVSATEF